MPPRGSEAPGAGHTGRVVSVEFWNVSVARVLHGNAGPVLPGQSLICPLPIDGSHHPEGRQATQGWEWQLAAGAVSVRTPPAPWMRCQTLYCYECQGESGGGNQGIAYGAGQYETREGGRVGLRVGGWVCLSFP